MGTLQTFFLNGAILRTHVFMANAGTVVFADWIFRGYSCLRSRIHAANTTWQAVGIDKIFKAHYSILEKRCKVPIYANFSAERI